MADEYIDFLQVCAEEQRFEKLMEYFKNEDNNIDFMVCFTLLTTVDATVIPSNILPEETQSKSCFLFHFCLEL